MSVVKGTALRKALQEVRDSIQSLDRTVARLMTRNGDSQAKAAPTRRFKRLSKRARAGLVLQGRYMGYMRQLKPAQKAKVRKVREISGVRAAIVKAKNLAS